jgi:cytochrome c oxidase subunit 2
MEKKKMAAKLDDPSQGLDLEDITKRGEKVYATNCVACHQANGKGAGPIKPLDAAPPWCWMLTRASKLPLLLNGQNNGAMPAWKQLE